MAKKKKNKPKTFPETENQSLEDILNSIKILTSSEEVKRYLENLGSSLLITSSPKTFFQALEEIKQGKHSEILKHSVGRGHTAAQDLVNLPVYFDLVPRLFTLFLTDNPYYFVGALQRSTRRVEHIAYAPIQTRDKNLDDKVKEYYRNSKELFNRILNNITDSERPNYRELAMYAQPLSLLTSIFVIFDWRNINSVQKHLELLINGENPAEFSSLISKINSTFNNKLGNLNENLIKDLGQNYNERLMYPSRGLFTHSEKSSDILSNLEKALQGSDQKFEGITIPTHLKNSFKNYLNELIHKKDENSYDTAQVSLNPVRISFYLNADLSLIHEIFRHRTLNIQVGSIFDRMQELSSKLKKNENFDISPYFTIPPQLSDKYKRDMLELYKNSIELFSQIYEKTGSVSEALLVVPHALKLPMYIEMSLPSALKFFGDRLCYTAKSTLRSSLWELVSSMRNSEDERVKYMGNLLGPKCAYLNACPEEKKNCPQSHLIGSIAKLL